MTIRTVCDGCGATSTYREKVGSWARLFVPSDSPLFSRPPETDTPELDLCPHCLSAVQSLLEQCFPLVRRWPNDYSSSG